MAVTLNLGALFQEVERITFLERQWTDRTPVVLVKTPSLANRNEKRISVRKLGDVRAFELNLPGPRGGKGRHVKHVDGAAGGWSWKDVDVRIADGALLNRLDELDAKAKVIEDERRTILRERFLELKPVSWDELAHARDAWKAFEAVYRRAKDGKATPDELRAALDELLGRPS